MRVVLGELVEQDCRDFATTARAETPPAGFSEFASDFEIKKEVLQDSANMRATINRAKTDPFGAVQTGASMIESIVRQ